MERKGWETFSKWIIRRGVSFWEGSFCSVFVWNGSNSVSPTNDKREQRSPRILGVTTLEASLEALPNAKSLPTFALLRSGEIEINRKTERERKAKTKRSSRWWMSQRLRTGTKGSEVAKRDSAISTKSAPKWNKIRSRC